MTGPVVVGVDGSPTARKAAEAARDLAAALGATLHVVSAFDSDRTERFGSGSDKWLVSDADKAEHVARTVADTLGGDIKITYSAASGLPAGRRAHQGSYPQRSRCNRGGQPQDARHRKGSRQRGQQRGSQCALRRLHRQHVRHGLTAGPGLG